MTIEEILTELEEWASLHHEHHYGCEETKGCCPGADRPYVDSLSLVAKIGELRKGL